MKHLDEIPWSTFILFGTMSLVLYITGLVNWYKHGALDAKAEVEFILATAIMFPVLIAFFALGGYGFVVDNIKMYLKVNRRFKRNGSNNRR